MRAAGIGAAATLAGRLLAADAASGAIDRPNVVWLIAEDLCPDLGCYGEKLVKTPNIDRLAAQGMRFDNAFVTAPVCSPARSAFFTGMYQTTIGAHQHRTASRQPLPDGVQILPDLFRAGGYFVTNTSFGHHRRAAGDEPEPVVTFTREGKTDWNFRVGHNSFDGVDWSKRKPGQPFFAAVNFDFTHRPLERDPLRPIDPDKVKVPPYYPDTPLSRRDWANYLESAQLLDDQVGRVLDRLDKEGLADNTIVMFLGDNGRPHVRGKQWLYEGGIRVPMIVRWPGHVKAGSVCDELVSSIDWAPTSLSLAGLPVPKWMQGVVCMGPGAVKRDFVVAARDRCDEMFDRIRCVRTKRYKYIRNFYPELPYLRVGIYQKQHYPDLMLLRVLKAEGKLTDAQKPFAGADRRPAEELYDLQADPDEVRNLAADPACKAVLEDLRGKLDKWIKDTGDKGETREPPEVTEKEKASMMKLWVKTANARGIPVDISDADYLKWWQKTMLATTGTGNQEPGTGKTQ